MKRSSSSTLLTRLALALLAVLGFVAPLAMPEGDRVVQTAGGKPSDAPAARGEVEPAPAAAALAEVAAPPPPLTMLSGARGGITARRYLLHRAWLV